MRGTHTPGPAAIQSKLWRDFYSSAFHEYGDKTIGQLKVAVAITACLWRLLEIIPERSSEREEILIAIDDLRILKGLYRKNR
jgi:hypothetical protein